MGTFLVEEDRPGRDRLIDIESRVVAAQVPIRCHGAAHYHVGDISSNRPAKTAFRSLVEPFIREGQ